MITIQNNENERRILLLDSPFPLEESPDFPEYLFDAVFIFSDSVDTATTILHTINPVTSVKCCYKPFFVSRSLEGKLGECADLIDGYYDDWNDIGALRAVEDILTRRNELGLNTVEDKIVSANQCLVRLFRYLIIRDRLRLVAELDNSSATGYVFPIINTFYKLGWYTLSELFAFFQSMLEKGYIRSIQFVNRIYLCPKCLHSHLLYIESCPKCGNSMIQSEEVIHHFRCANITPEHTYNFGGQLRCPKCHQMLHHIGVDYDRPATVFTCDTCGNSFLQAQMQAVCTNCHSVSDVKSLIPQNCNDYEITKEGVLAITSINIGFSIYTEFYDNFLEFDRFVNRIRLLAEQKFTGRIVGDVLVGKIWILDATAATVSNRAELLAQICKYFPNNKVSAANNITYINAIVTDYKGDQEQAILDFQILLSEAIRAAAYVLRPGEQICYTYMKLEGNGANIDQFLNDLKFVAATPDDSVEYSPDAINPNSNDDKSESLLLKDDGTVDVFSNSPHASEIEAAGAEDPTPPREAADEPPVQLADTAVDTAAGTKKVTKTRVLYIVLAALSLLIIVLAILIAVIL